MIVVTEFTFVEFYPLKEEGNVAEMVLKLSKAENYRQRPPVKHGYVNGFQPCNYVNEIFMGYQHYCDFIKKLFA